MEEHGVSRIVSVNDDAPRHCRLRRISNNERNSGTNGRIKKTGPKPRPRHRAALCADDWRGEFLRRFRLRGIAMDHWPVPRHARSKRTGGWGRGRSWRAAGLRAALLFRLSEKTRQFWPLTLFGYFVQMAAVPALALAGNWQIASLLIVSSAWAKRSVIRRATSCSRTRVRKWALAGPSACTRPRSGRCADGSAGAGAHPRPPRRYRLAFATLLIPAIITAVLIVVTKFLYPRPEDLEPHTPAIHATGLGRSFWIYLVGAALVAAGFADFR